jgi:hypothetical protein
VASEAVQNLTENPVSAWWTGNRSKAVQHAAEDILTDEQIAAAVGVTRQTIATWRKHPEFEARRRELVAEMQERARQEGLGRLDVRMARYARRAASLDLIVTERADDPDMQDVPGGKSGFLVRQFKSIGTGPNARQVEEYHFDAALSREMRELEKQAAQDAGQWSEKQEISGAEGGPVIIRAIEVPRTIDGDA